MSSLNDQDTSDGESPFIHFDVITEGFKIGVIINGDQFPLTTISIRSRTSKVADIHSPEHSNAEGAIRGVVQFLNHMLLKTAEPVVVIRRAGPMIWLGKGNPSFKFRGVVEMSDKSPEPDAVLKTFKGTNLIFMRHEGTVYIMFSAAS